MNTKSLGPNLVLAPEADPSDTKFEVVMVYENQRSKLASYVEDKLQGLESNLEATILTGRQIHIKWEGEDVHADDEILEGQRYTAADIGFYDKTIKFLVP